MSHAGLILACLALVGVIARQDYLVPALRSESISAGLTGPYHVALDAAYAPLALFLPWATYGHGLMFACALIASLALVAVAVTNTAWAWVDSLTGGKHALWHSRATTVVFASALALEAVGSHGLLWALLTANIAVPGALYLLSRRSDLVEKVGVLLICIWLIAWAA